MVGNLAVSGEPFACARCHLKSGFGASEGSVLVRPVTGPLLFAPLFQAAVQNRTTQLPPSFEQQALRPAYTRETLARAIRFGVDPAGRTLHPMMPRYQLDDVSQAALLDYLQQLSSQPSVALGAEALRLATIVGPGIDPAVEEAHQSTLTALVRDHNAATRDPERRRQAGAFYMRAMTAGFRHWELDTWRLSGAPESWPLQLEQYQFARPAFALVGGLLPGSWQPVQSFCEQHRLPALFPLTDLPGDDSHWYTLYFSMGYEGEGARFARVLEAERAQAPTLPADASGYAASAPLTVQVVGDAVPDQALARGALGAWSRSRLPLETWHFPGGRQQEAQALVRRLSQLPRDATVLLWLEPDVLRRVWKALDKGTARAHRFVISGRRLGMDAQNSRLGVPVWSAAPPAHQSSKPSPRKAPLPSIPTLNLPMWLKGQVIITWPYLLPEDVGTRNTAISTWLKTHHLPETHGLIRTQLFAAVRLLDTGFKMMRDNLYPDYLLDRLDMMPDETASVSPSFRQSYGPGQRFASKGCYLLSHAGAQASTLTPWRDSGWVY